MLQLHARLLVPMAGMWLNCIAPAWSIVNGSGLNLSLCASPHVERTPRPPSRHLQRYELDRHHLPQHNELRTSFEAKPLVKPQARICCPLPQDDSLCQPPATMPRAHRCRGLAQRFKRFSLQAWVLGAPTTFRQRLSHRSIDFPFGRRRLDSAPRWSRWARAPSLSTPLTADGIRHCGSNACQCR